jgi:hypothetical protein
MIDVPIVPYDATHSVIHVSFFYDSMHEGVVMLMQLSSKADPPEELAKVDEVVGTSLFLSGIKNKNSPLIAECERAAGVEIAAKFGTAWTALIHFAAKHRLTLV